MDAAPLPITLGKQDVLNAIENMKKMEDNTKSEMNKYGDKNKEQDDKNIEEKNKKLKAQDKNKTPPTSPNKGSLVIVKHGIRRKRGSGHTYGCSLCSKGKKQYA